MIYDTWCMMYDIWCMIYDVWYVYIYTDMWWYVMLENSIQHWNVCICIYTYTYLSLSIYLYIYIYIIQWDISLSLLDLGVSENGVWPFQEGNWCSSNGLGGAHFSDKPMQQRANHRATKTRIYKIWGVNNNNNNSSSSSNDNKHLRKSMIVMVYHGIFIAKAC